MEKISDFAISGVIGVMLVLFSYTVLSAEEGLNSEKIISELEKQMDLSREKWEKLKPVIKEKSEDLSRQMKDSVDKGFAEIDELTQKFDTMSQSAEQKVKDFLSSEEVINFREQLAKIDREAINEAKNEMVADLNSLLELTEEQAQKLKPILEDSLNQMSDMIRSLEEKGTKDWEAFKKDFEKVTRDLYDKVKETLDDDQMEKLEEYNEEQKEEIRRALFTV